MQSYTRSIWIASLGTFFEWAEYTFYAYFAYFLSKLFFPATDPYASLLMAYGTFAMGYFMRPLGAIIFGYYGDRFGRKPAFMYAILLMAIGTAGIGLMPTYATWGVAAPIGLLCCRLIQGLSMGGEYHGAGIYILEHPTTRPHLQGSWVAAAAAMGMVAGASAAAVLALPDMPSWAWRVPFLMGSLGCGVLYLFRRNLAETNEFLKIKQQKSTPLWEVVREHKSAMLRVIAIAALIGVHVYIANVYWATFLIQSVGFTPVIATRLSVVAELFVALLTPLMGLLADKWGGQKQFQVATALLIFTCPLMFWLSQQGTTLALMGAIGLFAIMQSLLCGPLFKVIFDAFPAHIRYTGLSVSWSISAAIFSSTAPMVAVYLNHQWTGGYGPSMYVAAIAALTYVTLRMTTKHP